MKAVSAISLLGALAGLATAVVPGATPDGDPYCALSNPETGYLIGNFDPENLTDLANDLRDNGACAVPVGPGVCIRVACGNTSGIYVCNDRDYPIEPDCSVVAMYVDNNDVSSPSDQINVRCGCGQFGCDYASGQIFFTEGWNIIAAYANCNNSPMVGPFDQ